VLADAGCPQPFLEAFLEGTEPTQTCSEVDHLRVSLPYYLQRFEIDRGLELRIDSEALVRLVNEGQGELELAPGGHELILHEEGGTRTVKLDMGWRQRREAQRRLDDPNSEGGVLAPLPTEPAADAPVGVDGRPATIIPIKHD
jgi:hypothetical protein